MNSRRSGLALAKESAENATIPATLPRISSRYASSGRNRAKLRATPSPIIAITVATAIKTTGRVSHVGKPVVLSEDPDPKNTSWAEALVT